jgi:hypothetical protein
MTALAHVAHYHAMSFAKAVLPALFAICASGAGAHHSFGGIYDSSKDITLDGVVSEFHFVHPHPILVIQVVAESGSSQSWRAEMDNRFELADIGVTAQTFRPGDQVRVSGSPGRNEPRILYLWKLERASDGLRYEQVGSTPHIHLPKRAPSRTPIAGGPS